MKIANIKLFCTAICTLALLAQAGEEAQEYQEKQLAQGEENNSELLDQLFEGWSQDSAKARTNASISFLKSLPENHLYLCKEIIKRSSAGNDPEIWLQTKTLLKTIYQRRVLGESLSKTGLTLGWFIDIKDGLPTSYPLVVEIEEKSPAALGGFVRGDVILSMNGKSFEGVQSRNLLVRELAKIHPGKKLHFKVKNASKDHDGSYDFFHKIWKGDRQLTTSKLLMSEKNTAFDEKLYHLWLSQLSQ